MQIKMETSGTMLKVERIRVEHNNITMPNTNYAGFFCVVELFEPPNWPPEIEFGRANPTPKSPSGGRDLLKIARKIRRPAACERQKCYPATWLS